MKSLFTIGLFAVVCSVIECKSEELQAGDLARALGIHWCIVQLPDSETPLKLKFVIQHSDGEQISSGAMGGFKPGSKINAYFWPADDTSFLNVAITSDTGVMRAKMKNPESKIMTYPVLAGEITSLGKYIIKGSRGSEVSGGQELQNGEFGIFLEIKP